MEAFAASLLAASSCCLVLLLPVVLRKQPSISQTRDDAWRDRLPTALRLLRPIIRWYASSVDQTLPSQKRDVLQTQLNSAGAAYMVTPAELVVIRRLAFALGCVLTLYFVFVLDVEDTVYLLVSAGIAPLSYFYPHLWLRDASKKRRARFEKEFPFFLDVLVLGMKGGLTLTAAIEQAVEQSREGPVREEFSRFLRDVRTGTLRKIGFDRLATRVVSPAVASFVAAVTQGF